MSRVVTRMVLAGSIAFGIGCSLITDLSVLERDGGALDATVDAPADATLDVRPDVAADGSSDAGADVAPDVSCTAAPVGATFFLPPTGFTYALGASGPLLSGTYLATSAFVVCFNCAVQQASMLGGLQLTVNGPNVTVLRRVEHSSTLLQSKHLDSWHGTFDQLNQKLNMVEDCPEAGATLTWSAAVLLGSDGGATGQLRIYFPDFPATAPDGGKLDLMVIFTKQ